jgi:RimJ/RimL family protein N-acetyltransferase
MNKNTDCKPEYFYNCMPRHYISQDDLTVMPIQPGHIEKVRQWRNDQMDVLRQYNVITESQQREYYHKHIWPDMKNEYPKNILLSIFENDVFVGYGGLVHIAWEHQRAEVSFLLDPKFAKNKARYTEIFSQYLQLIKRFAFEVLGLKKLCGETYAMRNTQISTLEATGFIREGVLKKHLVINGKRVDAVIHGCLSADLYSSDPNRVVWHDDW